MGSKQVWGVKLTLFSPPLNAISTSMICNVVLATINDNVALQDYGGQKLHLHRSNEEENRKHIHATWEYMMEKIKKQ